MSPLSHYMISTYQPRRRSAASISSATSSMNSDIGLQAIADDIGTPKGSSVDFKRHDQSDQEPFSKEHSSRKGEAKKQYHQKGDDMRKESRKTQCDQERQFRVVCCEENQDHDDPWNGPVDDV